MDKIYIIFCFLQITFCFHYFPTNYSTLIAIYDFQLNILIIFDKCFSGYIFKNFREVLDLSVTQGKTTLRCLILTF